MKRVMARVLCGAALIALTATVALAQVKTASKTSTPGTPTEKTQSMSGTVVQVEGNTLAVKMSTGGVRVFTPPADRRFVIDGKEVSLSELQPGTTLRATVKEITTPVTDRTVEVLTGRVWYVAAPTVILTLENGENKQYNIPSSSPIKFKDREGKEMTVFELRKGMNVTATRITEAPRTEFVTAVAVTGSGPRAGAAPTTGAAAAAPAPARTATAPAAPADAGAAAAPRKLPKTASPLPLVGLSGLLSVAVGLGLTTWRRRRML